MHTAPDPEALVELGVIVTPHGVRGQVKIRCHTEYAEDIVSYGTLRDEHGKPYDIAIVGQWSEGIIAQVKGVADRDGAEALRGTKLYVPKSSLPPPAAGEYYHVDLIGLEARLENGSPYGKVIALHNYGAGDVLEIRRSDGSSEYLPFREAIVIGVDIDKGYLTLRLPEFIEPGEETPR